MSEPMFTYEELALLDSLVNPAKWKARDEAALAKGKTAMGGGDAQAIREAGRTARQRYEELDALSQKVAQRRRESAELASS